MVIYYARVFFTLQFVNVNILLNIHLFTYFVSPLLRYGSFCLKLFYRVFILEIFQKKGGHPTDPCRLQREEARRPLQALAGDPAIPADRNILKGRKSHEKTAPFCTCNAPVCHTCCGHNSRRRFCGRGSAGGFDPCPGTDRLCQCIGYDRRAGAGHLWGLQHQ